MNKRSAIFFNGKRYILKQEPFRDGDFLYRASAKDENGDAFIVFWEIVRPDLEEDQACDWNDIYDIVEA